MRELGASTWASTPDGGAAIFVNGQQCTIEVTAGQISERTLWLEAFGADGQ
jgi:hypothetical protein